MTYIALIYTHVDSSPRIMLPIIRTFETYEEALKACEEHARADNRVYLYEQSQSWE